jgi:hypothetical protein
LSSELSPVPDDLPPPNIEIWPAGKSIVRVHNVRFGATEFNPGFGEGRFHPLNDAAGVPVATLYASNTLDGALSETVFHDVPVSGALKLIRQSKLLPMLATTLSPLRDLMLIQLRGFGLKKLGVTRAHLIDSDADRYATTRQWAAALHHRSSADGLIWMSRQHDSSEALVLFGDRVERSAFDVIDPPRSLYPPSPGWIEVLRAAESAGITIVIA